MDVVTRLCEACGSARSQEVYRERYASIVGLEEGAFTLHIVICSDCGFVYSNPAPSRETLARYYRTFSNYLNPQRQGAASPAMSRKWERTCDLVERGAPPGARGTVLEVGCATGNGLALFKARGWNVLGLDPSPAASHVARSLYGIEVRTGTLERHDLGDRAPFDVIVLSHVLEHLLDPGAAIRGLAALSAPGGLLYLEVPNLLRPFVPTNYFPIEHVNYFTPTTLDAVVEANGFVKRSIDLFDNSDEIQPFYPVIAGVYARDMDDAQHRRHHASDFENAFAAVAGYRDLTDREAERLRRRIAAITAEIAPGRLALFGAGVHTSQLLPATGLRPEHVAHLYDNDPTKHGKRLSGIPISAIGSPADVRTVADAILISSRASEREIYDQLTHFERHGIRVFRLYD